MSQRHFLGISFVIVIASLSSNAAAQDASNVAAAESLFQEGLAFKAQQNYGEACKRFARSEELAPAVGTLLNLGECYEPQHKVASAWLAYRQAISIADANSDERRRERARTEAARLEPRVPHLTIAVAASEGVTVMRDGVRVERAALNAAVALDPGRHVIRASAPAHKPWETTIDVGEGESPKVIVPALAPNDPPRGSVRRTIGIGMEIFGGAVLAAGITAATIALVKWRAIDDDCPNHTCPRAIAAQRQDDVGVSRTWANLGTVGLIAGGTILAAGVALHLTAPHEEVSLAPAVGRDAAGVTLVWRR